MSCCELPCAKEAMDFFQLNNGFLPPITKSKDRHFTNPTRLLEYYDRLKIPGYDSHCPSLQNANFVAPNVINIFQLSPFWQTTSEQCLPNADDPKKI